MASQKKVLLASAATGLAVALGFGLLWQYRSQAGNAPFELRPGGSRPAGGPMDKTGGETYSPASDAAGNAAGPRGGPDRASLKPPSSTGSLTATPDITAKQGRAMDASLPERERLTAAHQLRPYGKTGLTPEVLASLSQLISTSSDEQIRSELCRILRGGSSPEFCQQLMATVRLDGSARVRSEAARSLAPMASDPAVRQTLETALQNEKDGVVKHQLEQALSSRH